MNNQDEVKRVTEIRRMSEAERDRVLEKAAASIANAYATDPALTALEDYDDISEGESS